MSMPKVWKDKAKGLWRCSVSAGGVRHHIKRKERSEVVKELGKIQAGLLTPVPTGETFEQVALEFLLNKEARSKPGAFRFYDHHVNKKGGMLEQLGARVYAEITPADYQRYIDHRLTTPSRRYKIAEPKPGEPPPPPPRMLSPQTVEHERSILIQIALFAVERGFVERPTITKDTLKKLKVPEAQPRMLTDAELGAVLRTCDGVSYRYKVDDQELEVGGEEFRALLELALHTGLRLSELERMTWDWIDLDAKTLTVGGKGSKSQKLDAVPLARRAIEILKTLPTKRGKVVLGNWGPILEGQSAARIYAQLRKVARRAGITRFGMHAFRHALGINTLRATRSLYVTQKFLRHRDPRQTLRYARLVADEMAEERAAVDERLEALTKVTAISGKRAKKAKR